MGRLLKLKEAAEILGISYSTAAKECGEWKELGIRVLQRKPGCHKQYFEEDIVKLRDGKFQKRWRE